MNIATTDDKVVSSSKIKLAPETVRIRNALIEKFSDQPIEDFNDFLQRTLEVETDELKRLGLLAARVHILRQKVLNLKIFIRDETMSNPRAVDLRRSQYETAEESSDLIADTSDEVNEVVGWQSLQMIEPGEINGVRFFKGTVINAKAEDADRLISSGKAIVIDDEGNPIEKKTELPLENIDTKSDTHQNNSDSIEENSEQADPDNDPPIVTANNSSEADIKESSTQPTSSNGSNNEKLAGSEKSLNETEVEEKLEQLAASNKSENNELAASEKSPNETEVEQEKN